LKNHKKAFKGVPRRGHRGCSNEKGWRHRASARGRRRTCKKWLEGGYGHSKKRGAGLGEIEMAKGWEGQTMTGRRALTGANLDIGRRTMSKPYETGGRCFGREPSESDKKRG